MALGGDLLNFIQEKVNPPEMHLPGYNFCGPFTKLEKRFPRGDKGINQVDEACKRHDITYYIDKQLEGKHKADDVLVDELNAIDNPTLNEKIARAIIKPIIKTKRRFGLGTQEVLKQLYTNPKTGFTGINDLQRNGKVPTMSPWK